MCRRIGSQSNFLEKGMGETERKEMPGIYSLKKSWLKLLTYDMHLKKNTFYASLVFILSQ